MDSFTAKVIANILFIVGTLILMWTFLHWLKTGKRKKNDQIKKDDK